VTPSSNKLMPSKAAICIKEMAALVGLSRQRFMQLVKSGVFPAPLKDESTGRPYFTDEMQATCLAVRCRNHGVNGQVVMFYARRSVNMTPACHQIARKPTTEKPRTSDRHADIVSSLHGLGLSSATGKQVFDAVTELFPRGTEKLDQGQVVRAVFLHLRGKNSKEKVGSKE
jgi:hypothetical protein